jgi:acyl-CoA thioester hydrolase
MPPIPHEPRLVTPVEVFYFDTDAGGVVHNVAYLRLIEIARSKLSEYLGWTVKEMGETGLVPVVARTEIDYMRPAKLGDILEIDARLAGMEKVRFYIESTIRRRGEETVIAKCKQTMVTVQLPGGRPQRVPEAWKQAYPQLLK